MPAFPYKIVSIDTWCCLWLKKQKTKHYSKQNEWYSPLVWYVFWVLALLPLDANMKMLFGDPAQEQSI